MASMSEKESGGQTVRSFLIFIYDSNLKELAIYQIPISVAAPFANRLFRELRPDWRTTVREPWYSLVPRIDTEFRRTPSPEGPTSLMGERYDPDRDAGLPIQMHPGAYVRSFVIRLYDFQTELHRGEYAVDDIFLHGARYLLNHRIEKGDLPADRGPYYYAIVPNTKAIHSVAEDILPEEAYKVEGVFRLPPRVKEEPRIQFRPVPEPPPDERDPADLGPTQSYGKGVSPTGRILIPEHLYAGLRRELSLSRRDEEGGYLLGNVYRQPGSLEKEDSPDFRWWVEVTDLLMGEGMVGSPARLLFTGDAWSGISRRRDREFRDRKLVGWFHTHIFPASDNFGLSGLDQDMHAWYLPRPWQVAILLNLEKEGDRTVRCYQRGPDGDLVETSFEVFGRKPVEP
jgi:hypothetical protein